MNLNSNLYHKIFEQSHAAIILLDQKVILDCTLKTGQLFQQPKEDLVDQPWSILFPVKQADGLESIKQFQTILENSLRGQAQDFTWLCQPKDKKPFQTQIKLQQIILADQTLFQVVIQEAFVHEHTEQALAGQLIACYEEILLKRATELETVVEVSTQIASILDPDELLHAMVDLTKSRFGLYHVHVYLLNTDRENKMLVLTAGSGEIGREMLKKGWQIPLGQQQSIVSRAARTRTGVLVNRVREERDWLPNALLPDTASELAVPMIAGGSLLGVLDIQSEIVDYFVEEDIKIQTILATQVAIALQNARLYAQTQGQAEQEYLVNTITQKIQNTMTIEGALQTAIQELGQALQAPCTYVELAGN